MAFEGKKKVSDMDYRINPALKFTRENVENNYLLSEYDM